MANPRSLKPEDWPDIDRQLWHRAQTFIRFDDIAYGPTNWGEKHTRKVLQSYGQWLAWLKSHGRLDPATPPNQRVSPEHLRTFIMALQERVSPWSTVICAQGLHAMLKALHPHDDWQWVGNIIGNLKRNATPSRDKRPHLVSPQDIYALGIDLMKGAKDLSHQGKYHAATMGRDGLIIAMLICCPGRIGNMSAIEIDRHLIRTGDTYLLRFRPEETKNRRLWESGLPAELSPWIDEYLQVHRPALLTRRTTPYTFSFWISRWGLPMIEHAFRDQVKKRTKDAFGTHIWPHLFRTIAATGIIDFAPEHAQTLPDLLGHANFQTTAKHYILADATRAHSAAQSVMEERRMAALERLKMGKFSQ